MNHNLQACVGHVARVNAMLPVCSHIDRRKTGMKICLRDCNLPDSTDCLIRSEPLNGRVSIRTPA
jgi:hypothetical protein